MVCVVRLAVQPAFVCDAIKSFEAQVCVADPSLTDAKVTDPKVTDPNAEGAS